MTDKRQLVSHCDISLCLLLLLVQRQFGLELRYVRLQGCHGVDHALALRAAELLGIHSRPRRAPLLQILAGFYQLRDQAPGMEAAFGFWLDRRWLGAGGVGVGVVVAMVVDSGNGVFELGDSPALAGRVKGQARTIVWLADTGQGDHVVEAELVPDRRRQAVPCEPGQDALPARAGRQAKVVEFGLACPDKFSVCRLFSRIPVAVSVGAAAKETVE